MIARTTDTTDGAALLFTRGAVAALITAATFCCCTTSSETPERRRAAAAVSAVVDVGAREAAPSAEHHHPAPDHGDGFQLKPRAEVRLIRPAPAAERFDSTAMKYLTDPERAAVGYVSALLADSCHWQDAAAGILDCPLTSALGLGFQCSATHREAVATWLGDDLPPKCAKVPDTAFTQSSFDWLALRTAPPHILVTYVGRAISLPDDIHESWEEQFDFELHERSMRLVSRTERWRMRKPVR